MLVVQRFHEGINFSLGMPFLGFGFKRGVNVLYLCLCVRQWNRFPFYLYKVFSLKLLNDLEYNKAKISCNKLHKSFLKTIITVLLVHWNNQNPIMVFDTVYVNRQAKRLIGWS